MSMARIERRSSHKNNGALARFPRWAIYMPTRRTLPRLDAAEGLVRAFVQVKFGG
jgi:hypothetical protein